MPSSIMGEKIALTILGFYLFIVSRNLIFPQTLPQQSSNFTCEIIN